MAVLYKLQQDNRDTSQHKGEWYARANRTRRAGSAHSGQHHSKESGRTGRAHRNGGADEGAAETVVCRAHPRTGHLQGGTEDVAGSYGTGVHGSQERQGYATQLPQRVDRGQERQAHHQHAAGRHRQGVAEECGGDGAVTLLP